MAVPRNHKMIVFEMLEANLSQHVIDGVIDKAALAQAVDDQFRLRQPALSDAFTYEARRSTIYELANEYMRKAKHPIVVAGRNEDRKSKPRTRSTRYIYQIRQPDGKYIAKPLSACTMADVDMLIQQYDKRLKGASAQLALLRDVHRQMELSNIDNVCVGDVLDVNAFPVEEIEDAA